MGRSNRRKREAVRSTASEAPRVRRLPSALLVVAILLFVVTRCYIAFGLKPAITDITLYFEYSSRAVDRNKEPYRDFAVEYPPVAWWAIEAPRWLDGRRVTPGLRSAANHAIFTDYYQAYRLEMALFDAVSFGLFLAIVWRLRPKLIGWAAIVHVLVSTVLCHVLYDHLDEGALLLSMLGVYAWARTLVPGRSALAWSGLAFFFFGLGFSYKVIPILAVPFLLLGLWRASDRWKQLAAGCFGLAVGAAGPFAIQWAASGSGVFGLFSHHAGRNIQVESLYSTLMWIGSLFGCSVSISLSRADGSYCVFGDWASAMKVLSTVLLCGFVGGTWIWAFARGSRFGRMDALRLACYVLGSCVILSKVFSPQYFVWSIPMLLLAAVAVLPEDGRSRWVLAGLLIAVAGLTTWLFPYHYFCAPLGPRGMETPHGLIPGDPEGGLAASSVAYFVLAARNFLYLVVVTWLGWMVYKRVGTKEDGSRQSASAASKGTE